MARKFNVPSFYRSAVISAVKEARRTADPRNKDLAPSLVDFGPIRFKLARHFGFCYGVENAIEIAYRALEEHHGRRIFLLSEMIHNPRVNRNLRQNGIEFLRTTHGEQLIPFDDLHADDVVIIPAFGATTEVIAELDRRGVDTKAYDTTCPFVERVWKRAADIGKKNYSIVVHGKRQHEETRATFSHSREHAPVVVVLDLGEARDLASVIRGERDASFFFDKFQGRYSDGFDPARDLARLGVVNQTTMLAAETKEIGETLRSAMIDRYGEGNISEHFVDTSDTLCYATYENQTATLALIEEPADLAIVVGGYNSSNTSHLVELCAEKMPTYFVSGAEEILSTDVIRHYDPVSQETVVSRDWLPGHTPLTVVLTAGASCPDSLLEEVLNKLTGWYEGTVPVEEALAPFTDLIDRR